MRLQDIKIRQKLIIGFGLPIILSLILLIVSGINTLRIRNEYENLIDNEIALQREVLNSRVEINTAARYARDMVLDTEKTNYTENLSNLNEALDRLSESQSYISTNGVSGDDDEQVFLNAANNWEQIVPKITAALEDNDFEQAESILVNECTPALNAQRDAANTLSESLEDKALEIREAQKYSIVRMFVIMLILIAIFMVIVVIFASKLIRSIVKPLDETSLALNEIKNGNLNFNISYESMDEFGQMAASCQPTNVGVCV